MNETVRAGKYYLGDPSSLLPSSIYNGIWGDLYGYQNGKYSINDTDFVVHNTSSGDGIFKDSKNRSYDIKSGTIALIDTSLRKDLESLSHDHHHIFNFECEVKFIYTGGIFYIKSNKKIIVIDTRSDEIDSELDEFCENNEGEKITDFQNESDDSDKSVNKSVNKSEDGIISDESDNEEISPTRSFFKKK